MHPSPSNTMGDGTANACPIMLSKCKQIDRAGHCMQLKCPSTDGKMIWPAWTQAKNEGNKRISPGEIPLFFLQVTLQAFWWWTVDCVCTCKCPFSDFRAMLFLPHLSSAGGIVWWVPAILQMLSNIITFSATWIFSKFCLVPVTKFGAKVQLFCFFLPGLRTSFNCSSENAGNHDVFALPSLLVLRNKRCVICSPVEYWSISIIVVIATPKVLILVFF